MSKFVKRIKKLNKAARNVLIVGQGWGNLQDVIDSYSSIFLIDDENRLVRAKNVVYRENFDNLNQLQDVDLVLLDLDHENHIKDFIILLQRWSPILLIEGPELISKENQKLLKSNRYEIVEVQKRYYVWKCK